MASRIQHAKKMTRIRVTKVKKNISLVCEGLFSEDYKLKNGSWNISKIARDSGVSRNSVYKHLDIKKGN